MILVFDTSTNRLAIGIANASGELLLEAHAEATPQERGVHDARLARETERMLRELNLKPSDLARIGLILGPGSFTGLRIGLSFAKGLASALDIPIIGLSQHEVLKHLAQMEADYLITAGYQPKLAYVSPWSVPATIELMQTEEVRQLQGRIVAHDAMKESPLLQTSDVVFSPISLLAIARITLDATHFADTESVEPLYITEFNVGK